MGSGREFRKRESTVALPPKSPGMFRLRRLLGVVVTLVAPASGLAQTTRVAEITAWVARVDSITAQTRGKGFDVHGRSAEGGELTGYFVRDTLRKLVAEHFGETGKAVECFYIDGHSVRYAARKTIQYDRPLSGRAVKTTHEAFWFAGDSLMQWRDTLGRSVSAGARLRRRGAEVRASFRDAMAIIKRAAPRAQTGKHEC